MHKQIAVLMGPTGAGKSALALEIAAARPAVIINADAMQMVSALRVLTARPTVAEEAQAEHALYGVLKPEEPTSVAVWLKRVEPVIRDAWAHGKLPMLVGGTGMYIKALMDGLAVIPEIPEEIRQKVRSWGNSLPYRGRVGVRPFEAPVLDNGPHLTADWKNQYVGIDFSRSEPLQGEGLHALLQQRDPMMAARLKPGDTQRILRALEVIEATGMSLATWQDQAAAPLFPDAQYHCFAAMHPREEIYARIDRRFERMMERGALEEVRALMEVASRQSPVASKINDVHVPLNGLLPLLPPIFRAHGVPELMAHLRGEMPLAEAIAKAQQNTRNYAKRQMTWLRNQLPEAREVQAVGQIFANI